MPDGALLDNEEELAKEYMGFCAIDTKQISIFIPEQQSKHELQKVVAHEVGHLIELDVSNLKNADQIEENDDLHEAKANHYEEYYMLTTEIIKEIEDKISKSV